MTIITYSVIRNPGIMNSLRRHYYNGSRYNNVPFINLVNLVYLKLTLPRVQFAISKVYLELSSTRLYFAWSLVCLDSSFFEN